MSPSPRHCKANAYSLTSIGASMRDAKATPWAFINYSKGAAAEQPFYRPIKEIV